MKFKDLTKLAESVQKMCAYAEEIKNRVNTNLETIRQTKDFITDKQSQLQTLTKQLETSEKILDNLAELLE